MIKRIKKKRNPDHNDHARLRNAMSSYFIDDYSEKWFLYHIIVSDPDNLSSDITYIKQGYECEDCGKNWENCECEHCPDCKFNRCLCMLDIERKTNYPAEERIRVAKVWWELSKLFDEPFEKILCEEDEEDKKFIKFIKSLTPNSSFPEYREIALDLLEAYDNKIDLSVNDLRYYDLSGMDLSGMDLSRKDFKHANLSKSDLSKSNLSNANLDRSDLSQSNLQKANLSNSSLQKTNLFGVNLSNANLSNANLMHSVLTRANLSDTNLKGSKFIKSLFMYTNFTDASIDQTTKFEKVDIYKTINLNTFGLDIVDDIID